MSFEVQQYCNVSGAQDTAIPAFRIILFLGARHESTERQLVDKFKLYMPTKHRRFLQFLREQTASLHEYVEECGDDELLMRYDEAVDSLVLFRSGHISLVTSYIINVKRRQGEGVSDRDMGTGGTPFMAFLTEESQRKHY